MSRRLLTRAWMVLLSVVLLCGTGAPYSRAASCSDEPDPKAKPAKQGDSAKASDDGDKTSDKGTEKTKKTKKTKKGEKSKKKKSKKDEGAKKGKKSAEGDEPKKSKKAPAAENGADKPSGREQAAEQGAKAKLGKKAKSKDKGGYGEIPADEETERKLLAALGEGFKVKRTRHYSILHNTKDADVDVFGLAVEKTYLACAKYCEKLGVDVRQPEHKLVTHFFDTFEQYCDHTERMGSPRPQEGMLGYYVPVWEDPKEEDEAESGEGEGKNKDGDKAKGGDKEKDGGKDKGRRPGGRRQRRIQRRPEPQRAPAPDDIYSQSSGRNMSFFYNIRNTPTYKNDRDAAEAKLKEIKERARRGGLSPEERKANQEEVRKARWILNRTDSLGGEMTESTLQHEVTHQVLFNIGFHNRENPMANPRWFAEGMAQIFQPVSDGKHANVALVYRDGLAAYTQLARFGRLVPVERFVGHSLMYFSRPDAGGLAYPQAWAMMHYLSRTKRKEVKIYVDLINARPKDFVVTPEAEIETFTKAFGKPDRKWEKRWKQWMKKVH